MMLHSYKIALLGCLYLFGACSWAEDEVKVGVLDFPPFYEVTPHQAVGGVMMPEIAKLMAEAGLRYRVEGYPPKRLYRLLASGGAHFFIGLQHAPEYDGQVYVSPSPLNVIRLQLYRLPTTPALPQVQALAGKSLIVIRGYSYAGTLLKLQGLEPAPMVRETKDHRQALMMLRAGRADYLLDYSLAVNYTLRQMAQPPELAVMLLSELKLYLLVSKKAPNAQVLIQKLTQAMERLIARGELDSLRRYNQ